jgi:hypothetical protein
MFVLRFWHVICRLVLVTFFCNICSWRWAKRLKSSSVNQVFSLFNINNYNTAGRTAICKLFHTVGRCGSGIKDIRAIPRRQYVTAADITRPQTSIDLQNNLEDSGCQYRTYVTALFDTDWWTREYSGHFINKVQLLQEGEAGGLLLSRRKEVR